jgi:hypothetical protein
MVWVSVERLDHFGIVSSVIKDLGIIESKVSGIPYPLQKKQRFPEKSGIT